MIKASYSIADLYLEVIFSDHGTKRQEILPSFEPFLVKNSQSQKKVCTVELAFCEPPKLEKGGELRSDVSVVWGDNFKFYEQEDCFVTTIANEDDDSVLKMNSNKDFSQSVIYVLTPNQSVPKVISWLIMVAFGQTSLLHHTILIHASVISCHENGYAFLGKSGTGKSTHSRRWLETIEGAQLLNDDNPAIRINNDGLVHIYGTPWSGKTDCYKSVKVQIQAFVRLRQAAYNQMISKNGVEAFLAVLPSCTAIRWSKNLYSAMIGTLEAIVKKVPVFELACLPDHDAARLCHREILNFNN